MFENIGSKIKGACSVLFWLAVVGDIIGGLVGMDICIHEEEGGFAVLSFFAIPVAIMLEWVFFIFLYGFGELVENSTSIEREVRNIKVNLISIKNQSKSETESKAEIVPTFEANKGSSKLKCKACGAELLEGELFCADCGAKVE